MYNKEINFAKFKQQLLMKNWAKLNIYFQIKLGH